MAFRTVTRELRKWSLPRSEVRTTGFFYVLTKKICGAYRTGMPHSLTLRYRVTGYNNLQGIERI